MLDCQFFGLNPGGPHLVNVALHAGNGVLLFLLLERLTRARWRSALVASLFALHPLHVESVAWISERKDVLSTFFALLSMLAYVRYVDEFNVRNSKFKVWYVWALVLFGLSLMAKPMLVTLPFVLLLLDFWPMQRVENAGWRTFFTARFGRLVWEKRLWFVLAAASSAITFYAQKIGGAVQSMEYFPFSLRVANTISSYFGYVIKACWPVRLAVFYPLEPIQPGWLLVATIFLAVVSLAALATVKRWPFFLVGWLWFLGTLVPVIGLVQVGTQAMADRYTYMPLTGLFIAGVWGAAKLLRRAKAGTIIGAIAVATLLVLFSVVTVSQLQYWRNSLTLFTHTLAVTRDNAPANNNLGTALAGMMGEKEDAQVHYAEAVRIDPKSARYQNNLATALVRVGERDVAVEHYLSAIRDDPRRAEAYSNLGAAFLLGERRLDEAITNLYEAIGIDPNNGEARNNRANALFSAGRLDDALAQYAEAERLNPTNAAIRLNAGLALMKAVRVDDAMNQFAEAVRLNPASAEAHYEIGRQLFFRGQYQPALMHLEEAAKLKPDYASAEFYLAGAYAQMERFDAAIMMANRALESAQRLGQTNLVVRIQETLELYAKSAKQPFPRKDSGNN